MMKRFSAVRFKHEIVMTRELDEGRLVMAFRDFAEVFFRAYELLDSEGWISPNSGISDGSLEISLG